jgi:hypothetical protein
MKVFLVRDYNKKTYNKDRPEISDIAKVSL